MSFAIPFFARKNNKIVLCYYGSDLLRISDKTAKLLRTLVNRAEHIVVENTNMKAAFAERYGSAMAAKVVFAHYGIKHATSMQEYLCGHAKANDKELFSIPKNKICVLVGYNGSVGQRHLDILKELSVLPVETKNQLFILLHCSYGGTPEYISEIETALEKSGISGMLLQEYLIGDKLAAFRNSVDIMLNLQVTDCMSASVIECMEAGAVVIKGDWLVYPDICQFGGYLESIGDMEDLPKMICGIVENYRNYSKRCEINRGIIQMLCWSYQEWEKVL